jgi:tripartite-type tricarboxylate transporter receptor subunit TctC
MKLFVALVLALIAQAASAAYPERPITMIIAYSPGGGVGSDDHLLMLMFERAAGVKMVHVPFKGSADVRTAITSKQIAVAAMNIGEALQAVRGGAPMRNLGQFSPRVPTWRRSFPPGASRASPSSCPRCAGSLPWGDK